MSKTIIVNTLSSTYPIVIEKNCKKKWASELKKLLRGQKIFIITDENVRLLYGNELIKDLSNLGVSYKILTIPPGEISKSFEMYNLLATSLIESNISRTDLIVALGGGVVGDITGFVAATVLRGIDYVQIPTTLLAQVDSSIGGKVGINLPTGKNLLGNFYHPKCVFIDSSVLLTLDKRFISDAMAEVIKYACITDEKFFSLLLNYNIGNIHTIYDDIIIKCCTIKSEIVMMDEKENNLRAILNFGHTVGHLIENYFNYTVYSHGEAVGLGMIKAVELGEKFYYTKLNTIDIIKKILLQYNLPLEYSNINKEMIKDILLKDKKNNGDYINVIFIEKIGSSLIKPIHIDEIVKIF